MPSALRKTVALTTISTSVVIAFGISLFFALSPIPITGAYEATIVLDNGQSRLVGIAVFKDDRVIADGQTAKVSRWHEEGNTLTAVGADGENVFIFRRISPTELESDIEGGTVAYRKYDLPRIGVW